MNLTADGADRQSPVESAELLSLEDRLLVALAARGDWTIRGVFAIAGPGVECLRMSCEQEQANVDSCEARLREAMAKFEAAKAATPGTWLASTQNDAFNLVFAIDGELKEAHKQLDACREKSKKPEKPWRPWAPKRLGMLPREGTRPIPSARSVSTGLFALAAAAALAAVAAFAGVGPFAAQANAVVATTAPATIAPTAAAAQPLVPRISTGSGTISFVLPPRYTYGADGSSATINEYDCQNSTIALGPGNSGPREPAIGFHGLLGGHNFNGYFTPTRTYVQFQNLSLTPAAFAGPLGKFVGDNGDMHVAGTVSFQNPLWAGCVGDCTGSVTADLTCSNGPTAPPAAVSVAPAAAVATTSAPASPAGNGPWGVGLAVLALAAAAGGLATRSRGIGATTATTGLDFGATSQERATATGLDFDGISKDPITQERRERYAWMTVGETEPAEPGFEPTPPPLGAADDDEGPDRVPLE
jgi:hypothetical protein